MGFSVACHQLFVGGNLTGDEVVFYVSENHRTPLPFCLSKSCYLPIAPVFFPVSVVVVVVVVVVVAGLLLLPLLILKIMILVVEVHFMLITIIFFLFAGRVSFLSCFCVCVFFLVFVVFFFVAGQVITVVDGIFFVTGSGVVM